MNRVLNIIVPLRNRGKHTQVPISPNDLDFLSIIVCICIFIARTIKHAVGIGTPFVPQDTYSSSTGKEMLSNEQNYTLPNISLSMPLRLDSYHIQTFWKAVGATESRSAESPIDNAQLCLYLAALSEPAMLLLLAKRGCPVRPLGAVNVRNRFELIDPGLSRSLVRLSDHTPQGVSEAGPTLLSDVHVLSRFPRSARRVRRGIEIDIEVSIVLNKNENGSVHNESKAVFRQEFTMLQFVKFNDRASTVDPNQPDRLGTTTANTELDEDGMLNTVNMSTEAPHAWAQLCKDYNPIHFSSVLARLLGQSGQLAHGNHAIGVCVESMFKEMKSITAKSTTLTTNPDDPWTVTGAVLGKIIQATSELEPWWMEVRFRRPVVLPASIGRKSHADSDGFDIVDSRDRKVKIEVRFGCSPS